MTHFEAVKEFMNTMGQTVLTEPKLPSMKLANLRYDLIDEEVSELESALMDDDHIEIADALADILYVGYGAFAAMGTTPGHMEYNDGPWDQVEVILPTVGEARDHIQAMKTSLLLIDSGYQFDQMDYITSGVTNVIDQAYHLAFEMGIDLYACFDEVHASNMSKACKTYDDAVASLLARQRDPETAENYVGVVVVQSGEYFVLRKANGKILKGMGYFEPNLKQFMQF